MLKSAPSGLPFEFWTTHPNPHPSPDHDSQAECGRWRSFRPSKGWPCHFFLPPPHTESVWCTNTVPAFRNVPRPYRQAWLTEGWSRPQSQHSPVAADATWLPWSLQPASRHRREPAGSPEPMSVSCTERAFSAGRQAGSMPSCPVPLSWRQSVTARLHVLCVD